MKRWAIKGLVTLAVVVALCMFFSGTIKTISTAKVKLVTAKQGKLEEEIKLSGQLTFPQTEEIRIEGLTDDQSVTIKRVRVVKGRHVEEGDVLFEAEVSGCESAMKTLREEIETAQQELLELERKNGELRLRRTEDNDMHYRMRRAGYRFYFSPDILSYHAARGTLRGQLRQKWGNGYWIGRTMRIQPRCFAPRHLIPAAFVLALIALGLLAPWQAWPLISMLALYFALSVAFAIQAALRQPSGRLLCALCLPVLFPLVHIVYGVGTLAGLLSPVPKEAPHA